MKFFVIGSLSVLTSFSAFGETVFCVEKGKPMTNATTLRLAVNDELGAPKGSLIAKGRNPGLNFHEEIRVKLRRIDGKPIYAPAYKKIDAPSRFQLELERDPEDGATISATMRVKVGTPYELIVADLECKVKGELVSPLANCDDFSDYDLLDAARDGDTKLLDEVLGCGFEPNFMDHHGCTALHYATNSQCDVDKPLTEMPKVPRKPSGHWWFSLRETIQLLLSHGANPDTPEKRTGNTPLLNLAFANYSDAMNVLIEKQASVDHKNNSGHTALMMAANWGSESAVNAINYYGKPNLDLTDSEGRTAYDIARAKKFTEVARLIEPFAKLELNGNQEGGCHEEMLKVELGKLTQILVKASPHEAMMFSIPSEGIQIMMNGGDERSVKIRFSEKGMVHYMCHEMTVFNGEMTMGMIHVGH
tara:strand:+ start:1904 stop:3157 length:1254 start_codon:yes stop_codon:yes gene_type:complete